MLAFSLLLPCLEVEPLVAVGQSPLQALDRAASVAHATSNARVQGVQGFQGPLSLLARRDV